MIENYFIDSTLEYAEVKYLVLVIYDIVENKKRIKLSKLLESYGFRVQKSAFEALLDRSKYEKLLRVLEPYVSDSDDSIRVYKIKGKSEVTVMGNDVAPIEDLIII